jgi:hypothetical protein
MSTPWLYAIAAAARKTFDLEDRRNPIPVNIATYTKLVETGRIVKDPWWYITRNWKNVDAGDEVFIYTGDDDRGIVGFATVKRVEGRNEGWALLLSFDLSKCRALLRKPIPASTVRSWIPFPRGNVLSLEPFASDLYKRLPWRADR